MRRHFERLGITRLAKQTDLDRIGIPCFSAIRPNGKTLSASQGKGIDDDAAAASAIMEAAEQAIAEVVECPTASALPRALIEFGCPVYLADRQLPGNEKLDLDAPIDWVKGHSLVSGNSVYVPLDAVTIGGVPRAHEKMSRSTNGLASGNDMDEAIFHGLSELIERDATTLWGLRTLSVQGSSEFEPGLLGDAVVDDLVQRIEQAGMIVRLFDQTSDLGVPVIMATIFDPQGRQAYLDLASGVGCHPVAHRAALRAITEAAQTRVTNIAGARDDFSPKEYKEDLPSSLAHYAQASTAPRGDPPRGLAGRTPLPELMSYLLWTSVEHGIGEIIAVPLSGSETGFAVVRVIAPELEDRGPNINWRPGRRAIRQLI